LFLRGLVDRGGGTDGQAVVGAGRDGDEEDDEVDHSARARLRSWRLEGLMKSARNASRSASCSVSARSTYSVYAGVAGTSTGWWMVCSMSGQGSPRTPRELLELYSGLVVGEDGRLCLGELFVDAAEYASFCFCDLSVAFERVVSGACVPVYSDTSCAYGCDNSVTPNFCYPDTGGSYAQCCYVDLGAELLRGRSLLPGLRRRPVLARRVLRHKHRHVHQAHAAARQRVHAEVHEPAGQLLRQRLGEYV